MSRRWTLISIWTVALVLFLAIGSACRAPAGEADLVILGGRIVTLDPDQPEVEAVAVLDGRIAATGTEEAVREWIAKGTQVVDLMDGLAVPGFIEGHGHFMGLGRLRIELDLSSADTWEQVVQMTTERAATLPPGTWINGRGWHQEKWDRPPKPAVQGYPVNDALSRAIPDHPVHLRHASGHGSIANAAALSAAGIGPATRNPEGGEIVRRTDGTVTGILLENAMDPVYAAWNKTVSDRTPEEIQAEAEEIVQLAMDECLAQGITSFQDAGSSLAEVGMYRDLADQGRLPVRLWIMLGEKDDDIAASLDQVRTIGYGDNHLTVRAIKRYVDGALGSRGALLLEPYADQPDTTGQMVETLESLRKSAELARDHGYQLCTHAIGDNGNRMMLDLYEEVLAASDDPAARRWRIEHAQHLHPDDIPRFGKLGVVASIQGVHCTSDGPWVPKRLGHDRAESGAYPWRALVDSGAVLVNGTDTPVEPLDPIAGFHALITREMADGTRFHPGQALTRDEALRAMTLDAAWAAHEEEIKGSIVVGKLADLTVLDRDILTVPEDEIRSAQVTHTIIGGKLLYSLE
jgi:hypothetical protein